MIQIDFTDAERDALVYERYHHPLPHVQKRMDIVYLKSQGVAHQASMEAIFRAHPPRTVAEAQATIEYHTGIRRSPSQIRAFFKRLGMQVRKVGSIP